MNAFQVYLSGFVPRRASRGRASAARRVRREVQPREPDGTHAAAPWSEETSSHLLCSASRRPSREVRRGQRPEPHFGRALTDAHQRSERKNNVRRTRIVHTLCRIRRSSCVRVWDAARAFSSRLEVWFVEFGKGAKALEDDMSMFHPPRGPAVELIWLFCPTRPDVARDSATASLYCASVGVSDCARVRGRGPEPESPASTRLSL